MTEPIDAPEQPAYRPWQFSLRGLFVLTLSVAVGLSYAKAEQDWYGGGLLVIASWIVVGLLAQVGDLARSLRSQGDLSSDYRWGRRFAIAWRLGICCLLVVCFLLRALVGLKVLTFDDGKDTIIITFFLTRDIWNAVLVITIIAAVASSPRFTRPAKRRPWTWAVNGLGLAAAGVVLVLLLFDRMLIPILVHLTIVGMLSAQSLWCTADMAESFRPARILQCFDLTVAGVASLAVSCCVLWLWSRSWGAAKWKKVGLGAFCAASLIGSVLLTARVALVEIPAITPLLVANIPIPSAPRVIGAMLLVLIVATVLGYRWSARPAEASVGVASWRRDEHRYYHEHLLLLLLLGGVATTSLAIQLWSQFLTGLFDRDVIAYVFLAIPTNCLALALVLLAVQGLLSSWWYRRRPVVIEERPLAPSLFLAVWLTYMALIVCSVPLLAALGFGLCLKLGY